MQCTHTLTKELFLSFFLYAVYFYPVFLCYHATYRSRLANFLGIYVSFTTRLMSFVMY